MPVLYADPQEDLFHTTSRHSEDILSKTYQIICTCVIWDGGFKNYNILLYLVILSLGPVCSTCSPVRRSLSITVSLPKKWPVESTSLKYRNNSISFLLIIVKPAQTHHKDITHSTSTLQASSLSVAFFSLFLHHFLLKLVHHSRTIVWALVSFRMVICFPTLVIIQLFNYQMNKMLDYILYLS